MTIRPGIVYVLRGLSQRTDGRGNERKPLTLGKALADVEGQIVVRLRIGGAGQSKYAPRARVVEPVNVVREATDREVFAGLVLDSLSA